MTATTHGNRLGEHPRRARHIPADEINDPGDAIIVELLPLLNHDEEFTEDGLNRLSLAIGSADRDLVATSDDVSEWERLLDPSQVRVAFAQQLGHEVVARNADMKIGAAGHRSTPSEALNV